MVWEIDRFEVLRLREKGAQIVEVLPRSQYEKRHIAGAVNVPLRQLVDDARRRLNPETPVVTYCYDSLCDMSGRAAALLQRIGFREVYNYQASKVDWFGNGLPAEGEDADRIRLAALVDRDVPQCRLGEDLARVRRRIVDWDVCIVVDEEGVVLGLVTADAADRDGVVEDVLQEGPQTHRPDVTVDDMAEMLRRHPEPRVLVTNADGTLVGLVDPDHVRRAASR